MLNVNGFSSTHVIEYWVSRGWHFGGGRALGLPVLSASGLQAQHGGLLYSPASIPALLCVSFLSELKLPSPCLLVSDTWCQKGEK